MSSYHKRKQQQESNNKTMSKDAKENSNVPLAACMHGTTPTSFIRLWGRHCSIYNENAYYSVFSENRVLYIN